MIASHSSSILRRILTLAALAATIALQPPVATADLSKTIPFSIDPQLLSDALVKYSAQSGVQVTSPAELLEGKSSEGVIGSYSAQEALRRLLDGTNLAYEVIGTSTVTIRSVAASADTASSAVDSPAEQQLRLVQSSAQAATQTDQDSAPDRTKKADGSAAKNQQDEGKQDISEIVVTAQKRAENLQDVPIAISVLSGEQLDSSTFSGVTEALRTIPGLDTNYDQIGGGGGGAVISARGVSNATRYTGPGPIAYYIDGTPYGFVRSPHYPANPNIYDFERMEFLAGPQGTLYGANALNGVLRILTQNANPNDFEFKARTSVSGTADGGENYRGDLAVNVPLIEGKLAARAIVGYQNDSGWVDGPTGDDLNDEVSHNYRLKLRAQPTDTLSIDLSAWRSETDRGAPSLSNDDRRITARHDQPGFDEFTSYGLSIDKDLQALSISSVTSYVDYSNRQVIDADGPLVLTAQLDSLFGSKVFSEELNFTSNLEGPWRWSAGAFYRDAEDLTYSLLHFYPLGSLTRTNNYFTDTSESMAVYGEIGRKFLGDTLDLSFGLRYFRDDQRTELKEQYLATGVVAPYDSDSDAVTPRAVLTWAPVPDKTVYVSYSQGFRSGFAQVPNVRSVYPDLQPVEPDKLINYEIGSKGSLWERRASYTAAVFYIDWQDIQQSLSVQVPATGLFTTASFNGKSASGLGAELSITTRPTDRWEMSANASWNDLKFDSDVVSRTAAGVRILGAKGTRLNFSPEYTAGASVGYSFPLGANGLSGRLSLSGDYGPALITRTTAGFVIQSDSIFVAGAKFAIETAGRWKAAIYADNLTDEEGSPSSLDTTNITSPSSLEWRTRMRSRTVGLQLEYKY